jgi:transcriptional regulator with XRE-family HTH domain
MSNVTFGDNIRKRREEIELPLREVAAYLDIDTSTLSNVERGERHASPDYL